MRIAIVHEWLYTYAGAERVLEKMLEVFPEADLFSLIHFVPDEQAGFLKGKSVRTSFIQRLPFARTKHRQYLPLMPLAVEQFDLSAYDVVISNAYAVTKGVLTGPDQLHVSYVHSPMRYAWDLQHQYLKESGLDRGVKSWLARMMLHYLRIWDARTANGVDHFVTNSHFIARRVQKAYRRDATVIYPPVDVHEFTLQPDKDDFYLTASRMVPYKKIDLIVEAFKHMPDKKLVVIGEGPDFKKIQAVAGANVTLLGYQAFEVLKDHMMRAKAFVFAAEEDFGITPVEAQACGTPVIAFGKGGALETVRGLEHAQPTGIFFKEQTTQAVIDAVTLFEQRQSAFDAHVIRAHAEKFDEAMFKSSFEAFVRSAWEAFSHNAKQSAPHTTPHPTPDSPLDSNH